MGTLCPIPRRSKNNKVRLCPKCKRYPHRFLGGRFLWELAHVESMVVGVGGRCSMQRHGVADGNSNDLETESDQSNSVRPVDLEHCVTDRLCRYHHAGDDQVRLGGPFSQEPDLVRRNPRDTYSNGQVEGGVECYEGPVLRD